MKSNEIMSKIYETLVSRRLVSKLGITEDELKKYGRTIDYINVNRDSNIINGCLLSEYKIWKPFSDLILPVKVTLTGELRGKDLTLRDKTQYTDVYNASEFTNKSYMLNGAFKGSNDNIVSIQRDVVSLTEEMMKRISYNDCVRADASGTPIPFKDNLLYEDDGMFFITEEDYWKQYINEVLNKFTK